MLNIDPLRAVLQTFFNHFPKLAAREWGNMVLLWVGRKKKGGWGGSENNSVHTQHVQSNCGYYIWNCGYFPGIIAVFNYNMDTCKYTSNNLEWIVKQYEKQEFVSTEDKVGDGH